MVAEIIDGRGIAQEIRREVREAVEQLVSRAGIIPGLAVVLVGDDPASSTYVASKEKAAKECGMYSKTFELPSNTREKELLDFIEELNRAPEFHGILVQLPLPAEVNVLKVMSAIDPLKDIEGLHPADAGWLLAGEPRFVPCTPAGIHRMLLATGHHPEGQHVVVVGGSLIVGRPLAALLLQEKPWANATVTICHIGTRDLPRFTRQAEILVVATGNPRGITGEMVKEGAIVIDVGIHRIEDPTRQKGYYLVGDVDFESVKERAKAISPVPGGVGPMTVAMLLVNTLKAARLSARAPIPRHRVEDWEGVTPPVA